MEMVMANGFAELSANELWNCQEMCSRRIPKI